jgi:hypothetical protein
MNEQQLAAVKLALEALEEVAARTGARWALEQGYAGHLEAITAIKQAIAQDALDKKAENARELGLSYDDEPKIGCVNHDCDKCKAVQEPVAQSLKDAVFTVIEGFNIPHDVRKILESAYYNAPPAAQPAPVQEPVAWVPVTETLLNEQHPWLYKTMWIAMKDGRVLTGRYEWRQGRNPDRFYPDGAGDEWAYDASHVMPLQAPAHPSTTPPGAQPAPVKTYHDGKPWPVQPKPWMGLTADEMLEALTSVDPATQRLPVGFSCFACAIETKLKGKNHDQ